MIAIIAAMDEEIIEIRKKIEVIDSYKIAKCEYYIGKMHNKNVILVKTGIGKVNASMAMTVLFEKYDISYVINIGSAGGVKEEASVGDIVVADNTVYHDADSTEFGYQYGQIPGMPLKYECSDVLKNKCIDILSDQHLNHHIGTIGTGDSFIAREDQLMIIKSKFDNLIAVEMEACAIAQICYNYDVPYIILRALSDIAGKESNITFDKFLQKAVINSSMITSELVKRI